MRRGELFFLFGFILMISLASAVNVDNRTFINKDYLEGEIVGGRLYVNFSGDIAGRFTSNLKGGIDVLDLFSISNVSNNDYSCDPASCLSDYEISVNSNRPERVVNLVQKKNKEVFGFLISNSQRIVEIKNLEFNVSGISITNTCVSQIVIDLFNDDSVDFYNDQYVNTSCYFPPYTANYGCFEEDEVDADDYIILSDKYYCEVVKDVPAAPAYVVGTNLALFNSPDPATEIAFILYQKNSSGDFVPKQSDAIRNPPAGSLNVTIVYPTLEKFDGMVCIYQYTGQSEYRIRTEDSGDEQCGKYGQKLSSTSKYTFVDPSGDIDYDLFVRPLQYAPIENLQFEDSLYKKIKGGSDNPLKKDLNDYLTKVYNNDCSGGCIIPFAIWGLEGNSASLHNGKLTYEVQDRGILQANEFYELIRTPARITSDKTLVFDFEDFDFDVSDENGEQEFFLCLNEPDECDDDNSIFDEIFNVAIGFDFDVGPRFSLVKQNTRFQVTTSASINKSEWNFGDGSGLVESKEKFVEHVYSEDGEYTLTVTLTNSAGSTSIKRFKILVGNAKASVNATLNDYERRIDRIESGITGLPDYAKSRAEELINPSLLKRTINTERENYNRLLGSSSTKDEDYIAILNKILALDIPSNVFVSGSGTLPVQIGYGSDFSGIDVGIIKEASGYSGNANNLEIVNRIANWMENNYVINIGFTSVSTTSDLGSAELFKVYDILLTAVEGSDSGTKYLVIDRPFSSIDFDTITIAESKGGGTVIPFEDNALSRVKFSIAGPAPGVESLGIFVSPSLDRFEFVPELRDNWFIDDDGKIIWWKLIVGMSVLLIVFLIVYIILQTWYKNSYEKKLFKNPDDLYNLINFIYNSRKSGMYDDEIREKLKEKNWKGEQITYAFKKIDGKRTGMWEIPLFKFAENKKVKTEIAKRQGGGPVDTRFIKRPRFRVR